MPDKSNTEAIFLPDKAVQSRKKFPTSFVLKKAPVLRKRRKETFDAAQKIHGGTPETEVPGAVGIVNTALVKCSKSILVDIMSADKKFNQSVMPNIYKPKLREFELSSENMVRSISVYYSGGIAGKKKYRDMYRDSAYKVSLHEKSKKYVCLSINSCPIARLVPYN